MTAKQWIEAHGFSTNLREDRNEIWHDRENVRIVFNEVDSDGGYYSLFVFTHPGGLLDWQAEFSSCTPDEVIIAAVWAAMAARIKEGDHA